MQNNIFQIPVSRVNKNEYRVPKIVPKGSTDNGRAVAMVMASPPFGTNALSK